MVGVSQINFKPRVASFCSVEGLDSTLQCSTSYRRPSSEVISLKGKRTKNHWPFGVQLCGLRMRDVLQVGIQIVCLPEASCSYSYLHFYLFNVFALYYAAGN